MIVLKQKSVNIGEYFVDVLLLVVIMALGWALKLIGSVIPFIGEYQEILQAIGATLVLAILVFRLIREVKRFNKERKNNK